jgi:hypothetical protein
MTKQLPALRDQEARVAAALKFHHSAQASAAQMAVAAAKCGLELKAIKRECGHGGWEPFFESHFAGEGLSLRTAQRYIALADGLKSKALKNDTVSFLPLLDTAPSALTQAQQKTLTKEVGKLTDGATLSDLYQDFGIVKKPQGSGAKGGAKAGSEEEAPPADSAEVLLEGKKAQTEQLIALLTEALTDRPFNATDKKTRKKLHGLLVDVQSAVKETL